MAANLNNLHQEALEHLLNGLPLLSRAFWGPEKVWCEAMLRAASGDELAELGKLTGKREAAQTLAIYLNKSTNSKRLCETLEEVYVRLFISARGGIAASLHQSAYESEEGRLVGRSARMMASRLDALGLSLPGEGTIPEDHLAVEIEYLALLLEKGFGQEGEVYLETAKNFVEGELKPFILQFRDRLEAETECPFYAAAADLLLGLVTLISD